MLKQQANQTCVYTSFFKRERQYDPFRAKKIILIDGYCHNKQATYASILRSLSVGDKQATYASILRSLSVRDNMTRLERKKLS